MKLADLDVSKTYSYADYLTWRFQERVELIKGKLFKMPPAPSRRHQEILIHLMGDFINFFKRSHAKFIQLHLMLESQKNLLLIKIPIRWFSPIYVWYAM